jgi:hypothetical protein
LRTLQALLGALTRSRTTTVKGFQVLKQESVKEYSNFIHKNPKEDMTD